MTSKPLLTALISLLITYTPLHGSNPAPAPAPARPLDRVLSMDFWEQFTVKVQSTFKDANNPLSLHCSSKDDDLGDHSLRPSQSFKWVFRMSLFYDTVYSCTFAWGGRKKSFEIFNKAQASNCRTENLFGYGPRDCDWFVNESGFYIRDYKFYEW